MTIRIIAEPEIHLTEGELRRYLDEYNKAMAYHAGPRPNLEEWIRSRQNYGSHQNGAP